MGREVKIILKSHIPEDEIEALPKCFLPDILDFFESEEGKLGNCDCVLTLYYKNPYKRKAL